MSVNATLNAPGGPYRVLHFDYEFTQPVDANYVPIAVPRGGTIKIVIASRNDTSILAWMLATDRPSGGDINVIDGNATTVRTIYFNGGHCVYFREDFNADSQDPMRIHFHVACQRISINDNVHQQITWTEQGSQVDSGSSSSSSSSSGSTSGGASASASGGVSSFNPND